MRVLYTDTAVVRLRRNVLTRFRKEDDHYEELCNNIMHNEIQQRVDYPQKRLGKIDSIEYIISCCNYSVFGSSIPYWIIRHLI